MELLLADPRVDRARHNRYGQTALAFACGEGRAAQFVAADDRAAVARLLLAAAATAGQGGDGAAHGELEAQCVERPDLEVLGAGLTAAELARRAGMTEVADEVALAAAAYQIEALRAAVEAQAGEAFDSLSQRILALFPGCGLPGPRERGFGADEDVIMTVGASAQCAVCLRFGPGEVALVPCGHAGFCADCAQEVCLDGVCPVCRADVVQSMRVFF